MNKEISKMSKKEKKEFYRQFRNTWTMSPVTRKSANPKAYDRKKSGSWKDDFDESDIFFYSGIYISVMCYSPKKSA